MIKNNKYSKEQLINEIVWLFKEWEAGPDMKALERLQKYNKIFLEAYNCEFLDSSTYYYDHNIQNYIEVK